jgi:hypothetical protein
MSSHCRPRFDPSTPYLRLCYSTRSAEMFVRSVCYMQLAAYQPTTDWPFAAIAGAIILGAGLIAVVIARGTMLTR